MISILLLTTDGAVSTESPRLRFFVRDGDNSGNRAICMDYADYVFTFFRFDDGNIPDGMPLAAVGGAFFDTLLQPDPEAALEFARSLYHGGDQVSALPPKVRFNINSIWKSLEEFRTEGISPTGVS